MIIRSIYGTDAEVFKSFKNHLNNLDKFHPEIYQEIKDEDGSFSKWCPFWDFEIKLRRQLLNEIIEQL